MEVFFYGLFMDVSLLKKLNVQYENPRRAYLRDYKLKIGNRASLIPHPGAITHGMLVSIADDTVLRLYSEKSVADYLPEKVKVKTEENKETTTICYNLPAKKITGLNTEYAKALHQLAMELGFPEDYLEEIKAMVG